MNFDSLLHGILNRRTLFVVISIVLASGAVAALYTRTQSSGPILVGVALNLSGHGAARGQAIKEGIVIGAKELNEQGGIGGRPIKLLIEDDRNTKKGVIRADNALLKAGCDIILGHNSSQNTLIAYPLVAGRGKILITNCTCTTALSGKDDYFFRTSVDNATVAKAWARLLKDRSVRSLSVLADMANRRFSQDLSAQIGMRFHGQLYTTVIDTARQVDWNEAVKRLLASEPDVVLLITNPKDTAIAIQKVRGAGFEGPVYGTTWAQGRELFAYGGQWVNGLRIVTFVPPLPPNAIDRLNPVMKRYFQKNATTCTGRGYELMMIVADAMKRCGPSDITPACIKEKLLSKKYNILAEEVKFDRFGDIVRPIYEIEASQGKFVVKSRIL